MRKKIYTYVCIYGIRSLASDQRHFGHNVKLPAISPTLSPVVWRKEQTLLIPSEAVLQACLPTAKTLSSLRPPSPPHRRGRLAPANQGAYARLARGSRLSSRSSHAFSSPWILTRHPHPTNQTSQGSQPQPPQEPTVGNFSRRPSAARCCPLTAGPGGALPSSPGPAGCPAPPPARPVGPPLIVASPRAGLATSGCALLSSLPLHTT